MDKTIHIARWGTSGPDVVLVHGGVQGSTTAGEKNFSAQKPLADHGWRLIVPDRPGHGQSPDPGRPDDYAADSVWLAELLGDGAHLVGHSFGGAVALAAAAKRPGAVRSLTLIEPAMHALAVGNPKVNRFLLSLLLARLFSFSAAARAKRFLTLLGIPPAVRGTADPAEMTRMGKALTRGRLPSKQVLQDQLALVKREAIPLLVVSGGWSPAFEATCDRVAAAGGGRRAVILAGHHFPQLVVPAFNDLLEGFLRQSKR
ncbi:alpha/beta fold hydrolase [Beijerinckia sp. L45]|uniref:alpha/beta fold hydrolase n=1 Tax=Beijerinckia sp. L45 TaxID=1641855 RepID=UPI00131C7C82|nr:alpha/beta hydrolase [Beijerinckia sp. L45]